MPSAICKHPTCNAIIPAPGYCPDHTSTYDKYRRNKDAAQFYHSAAWQRARGIKLASQPTCERCGRFAEHVHHTAPVETATHAQRLDQRLLMSLCQPCHSLTEAEDGK